MNKGKKKFMSAALIGAMTFSLFPVTAFAGEGSNAVVVSSAAAGDGVQQTTNIAAIDAVPYSTLQEAINAATDGQTVTLQEDTAEDITIPADKNIVLNLNGKTLTNVSNHTIINQGTLTITGQGIVDNVTHAKAALVNNGTATLENCALDRSKEAGVDSDNNGGNSFYTLENYGTMTINSGVTVNNKGAHSSMVHNGWADGSKNTSKKNAELTINDGSFSGGLNTIKNDDYGALTINGGIFDSMAQAAFLNWNEATVNGGTFTVNDSSNAVVLNGYLDDASDKGELTINGGTFNAGNAGTVLGTMGANAKHSGNIDINGGTLNGAVVLSDAQAGGELTITQKAQVNGNVINNGHADVAITDGAVVNGTVENSANGTMSVVNSSVEAVSTSGTNQVVILNSEVGGVLTTNTGDAAYIVGGKTYNTMAEAVGAVKDGQTVYVLKDINDAVGVKVDEGKNFTIDFGGHDYILTGPGAGSATTETNGFQFLKNSNITMKNGTIRIAEGANNIKRIIQNYANLTLEDMHFYAENQVDGENYALSFNNGDVIFKGDTDIVTTSDDVIAFDVCKFDSYPSASVTFDETYTGSVNGKIVYDSPNADTHKLTIEGNGTFGVIEASTQAATAANDGIVVSSGHFSEPVNEEYLADTVKAQLKSAANTDAPYSYFTSVEDALAAAQPGDSVTEVSSGSSTTTKCTVTLDYADDATANSVYELSENTLLTLPAPTRSDYTFEGWYDGDSRVNSPYTVTKNVTLTARWSYNGGGGIVIPSYDITVDDSANGTVEANRSTAISGRTITLTVTPDDGYMLDTLAVVDEDGEAVELTKVSDSEYTFEMPKADVTVTATFTEIPAVELPFTDVAESAWYYDAVEYVFLNGLMNGTSETTFAPQSTLTRAMMAAVLCNMEENPQVGDNAFTDVDADAWYADAVNWAAANGIVGGYGDGIFGPNDPVTREQMASMLYRYAEYKGYDVSVRGDLSDFADADSISNWATEVVQWAVGADIIHGVDNDMLNPLGTATRAEVATILMNFSETVAK